MRIPLLINGQLLVTAEFRRSLEPSLEDGAQVEYDGEENEPDWNNIRTVLDGITSDTEGTRASTDSAAAEQVHRLLPLTKRQAANRHFWHFATVRMLPSYVVWRWRNEAKGAVPLNRYLGPINRNALARLWWLAELTHDQQATDRYQMTRLAGSHSEFFQWCVDTLVCANRAAASSLIHAVFQSEPPLNDNEITAVFKAVNGHLATHLLDFYDEHAIATMVMAKVRDVRLPAEAHGVEAPAVE